MPGSRAQVALSTSAALSHVECRRPDVRDRNIMSVDVPVLDRPECADLGGTRLAAELRRTRELDQCHLQNAFPIALRVRLLRPVPSQLRSLSSWVYTPALLTGLRSATFSE